MSGISREDASKSKVIEISAFKRKKEAEHQISRGRKPLRVDHKEGKISGRPFDAVSGDSSHDFADRLGKIRGSLDRINQLMLELKKISGKDSNKGPFS